jgi:hypothetical protein
MAAFTIRSWRLAISHSDLGIANNSRSDDESFTESVATATQVCAVASLSYAPPVSVTDSIARQECPGVPFYPFGHRDIIRRNYLNPGDSPQSPLDIYHGTIDSQSGNPQPARSPVAWRRENLLITLTLADQLHPLRSGFPRPCTVTNIFSVDLAVAASFANLQIPINPHSSSPPLTVSD